VQLKDQSTRAANLFDQFQFNACAIKRLMSIKSEITRIDFNSTLVQLKEIKTVDEWVNVYEFQFNACAIKRKNNIFVFPKEPAISIQRLCN